MRRRQNAGRKWPQQGSRGNCGIPPKGGSKKMNARLIVAIVLRGALGALTRFYISGILPVYKDFTRTFQ